jgi:dienelactone hydrolase
MNKLKYLSLVSLILIAACAPISTSAMSEEESIAENPLEVEEVPDAIEQVPVIDSVNPLSIEALSEKEYGLGELRVEYTWENKPEFTRYYITYDSDDLNIHGFVNIPVGEGPFPVVIALHGYIPPSEYETLDYSTRYADSIARKGYIVLHPNMRNFPPSDSAPRRGDYHSGFTTDVMNLLEYVRQEAGQEGSIFKNADLSSMGIWGHSLGGSVALRVASIVPEIDAIVLYAAVTQRYSNASAGFTVYDFENTDAAFQVHHGTADPTVRVSDSTRFCAQLDNAGKDHECFFYEEAPHTFLRQGQDDPLFIQRVVDFYAENIN